MNHVWTNKTISVEELKNLYNSNDYEIEVDTPDGYQPIGKWFNKGVLPLVKIQTQRRHLTICATNHLLEVYNDTSLEYNWTLAENLNIGDKVKTVSSDFDEVIDISSCEPQECFDFEIKHHNHRYWGDGFSSHNSGKSFICSGNIVREAQKQNIFVVLIDTENALDEEWLTRLGVDTAPDKLQRVSISMADDVAKFINGFVKEFKEEYKDTDINDRPKVLFVIDSLGMLMTPTEVNQFESGDMKGDMGRKAKQLRTLIVNCVNTFGNLDIGLVCTNHTYASQDMFNPDDKISGGNGPIFASSIVVAMRKGKLKEDEDGVKTKEVSGIRVMFQVNKSRYAKPFEKAEIKVPYETGMDPYSGLIDFFIDRGVLVQEGKQLVYNDKTGKMHKEFRKNITNQLLDQIMLEWDESKYGFKASVNNQIEE